MRGCQYIDACTTSRLDNGYSEYSRCLPVVLQLPSGNDYNGARHFYSQGYVCVSNESMVSL